MKVYLRTQTIVLSDIKNRLRDTANARWSDTEIYRAINRSLETWQGKVSVPALYTFTMTGFIHDLPEELRQAFLATLEGIGEADLLLHVVDGSADAMESNIASVDAILSALSFRESRCSSR